MPTILVIHHSADLDGICSREVARKALGTTADYLGWDYGQEIPDLAPYETVYLIDISLPPEVMKANAAKLIWIDHHKSAIEANKDTVFEGIQIDGVAACRLAWQWFHPNQDDFVPTGKRQYVDHEVDEPYAVQLLGEYDIWDKRNPDTDPFQLGMQAEKSPDWSRLFANPGPGSEHVGPMYVAGIIDRGRAIQVYTDLMNAQISTERGFDVVFEGLTFRALNIARCNSLTFTAALKPHHDGCLAYFFNGKKWRFSLYHAVGKEHHDLSQIAVKYGGGGHRGACGFELDKDKLPESLGGLAGSPGWKS